MLGRWVQTLSLFAMKNLNPFLLTAVFARTASRFRVSVRHFPHDSARLGVFYPSVVYQLAIIAFAYRNDP